MNKLSINTQSRNELNASIILAAITWSLTMIFADEIIAANGRDVFNLFPLLPVVIFSSAVFRHLKRVGSSAAPEVAQNMALAGLIASVFAVFYSQADAAITIYTSFAISLGAISFVRNCIKR